MPKKHGGTKSIKPPARFPSGDLRRPEGEKAHTPTLIRRITDHAIALGADERVASVLSLMFLRGELTERQAEAGLRYAELVGTFERVKGMPRRSAKSAAYEAGFGASGLDPSYLPAEDRDKMEKRFERRQKRITRQYERAQACIPLLPIIVNTIVEEVCCNDRPVHSAHHADLKRILDRLAEHFKVLAPAEEKQAPKTKPKTDAKHLAEGAVDAIERWFADARATIHAYDLGRGRGEARRLIGIGVEKDGVTPVERRVEIPVNHKLIAAAIDAQLVKAAEAKGWTQASRRRRFEPSRKRRAA